MILNWKIISGVVVIFILALLGSWFFFGRSSNTPAPQTQTFGTADTRSSATINNEETTNTIQPQSPGAQKIFKVLDGPVAGATFVQTLNPTTTIARYVLAENGRVFDLALDTPGAVPRAISNTTIPGVARVIWAGGSALFQYLEQDTLKSLALTLPPATTSSATIPAKLQFLPNNIIDIAASPDGINIVYLLRTATGADGYVARADGTGAHKLFSLPLSRLLLSWPTVNTIIAQAPPAFGIETVAFSINAQSGAASPLLYAPSLSLNGDRALSRFIYSTAGGPAGRVTYSHDIRTGLDIALSFDPLPEQCVWGSLASSTVYCAVATTYVPENYADLRNSGEVSVTQQIVSYDHESFATILALPGSADGGVASDIATLSLSLNERYLSFIKKGDRSLWGVRLTR